jgi:hypothetical protein
MRGHRFLVALLVAASVASIASCRQIVGVEDRTSLGACETCMEIGACAAVNEACLSACATDDAGCATRCANSSIYGEVEAVARTRPVAPPSAGARAP